MEWLLIPAAVLLALYLGKRNRPAAPPVPSPPDGNQGGSQGGNQGGSQPQWEPETYTDFNLTVSIAGTPITASYPVSSIVPQSMMLMDESLPGGSVIGDIDASASISRSGVTVMLTLSVSTSITIRQVTIPVSLSKNITLGTLPNLSRGISMTPMSSPINITIEANVT